jgi:8-oxo-dGTP pyrophosphatase MutT (NUDIX family)
MQAQPKMPASPTPPLSNLQLYLLKLYAAGVSEEDLKSIQRMVARYFAEKASAAAREVWEEKGYTASQLLEEDMRTPYQNKAE